LIESTKLGWGSTLTIPDMLENEEWEIYPMLGFNSDNP